MKEQNSIEPIIGYFVILGDERNSFKKNSSINARGGIFYKKEDLIGVIQSKKSLKKIHMDIVELLVPLCCITNPNCNKFGVKNGEKTTIINIQPFKEAVKEMMVNEVA